MFQILLNNKIEIPILGLGTYKIISQEDMDKAVFTALDSGYRLFDTAEMYANETQLGISLKKYGIKREDVFITSKIWDSSAGYENTIKAFEQTLKRLQTEYLDLYLIHWPSGYNFIDTWKAMCDLYEQGKIKAIGVSNFYTEHLVFLKKYSHIVPAVNQIEIHPYYFPKDTVNYCRNNSIAVESWSPVARGRILQDTTIKSLAKKYGKTPAQIVIRWHIQHNFIVIPKSSTPERIKENINVFDFQLSDEDVKTIDGLHKTQFFRIL